MHIEKGATRIVFIFRHKVVKVPRLIIWSNFLRGLLGNITENRTWKWNSGRYAEGREKLLCPVLWCSWGGWLLVMRKVEVVTYAEWKALTEKDITSYKQHFPGDDHRRNYGWYEGRLVKLDYASIDFATPVAPPLIDEDRQNIKIVQRPAV